MKKFSFLKGDLRDFLKNNLSLALSFKKEEGTEHIQLITR